MEVPRVTNHEKQWIHPVTLQHQPRRSQLKTSLLPATQEQRLGGRRKAPAADPCRALIQHLHKHNKTLSTQTWLKFSTRKTTHQRLSFRRLQAGRERRLPSARTHGEHATAPTPTPTPSHHRQARREPNPRNVQLELSSNLEALISLDCMSSYHTTQDLGFEVVVR